MISYDNLYALDESLVMDHATIKLSNLMTFANMTYHIYGVSKYSFNCYNDKCLECHHDSIPRLVGLDE